MRSDEPGESKALSEAQNIPFFTVLYMDGCVVDVTTRERDFFSVHFYYYFCSTFCCCATANGILHTLN